MVNGRTRHIGKGFNMVQLEKLVAEDKDGKVLLSDLFDIAVEMVYDGEIELDSFISCELDIKAGLASFSANTKQGHTLKLDICEICQLYFWCDSIPIHFNQYPIYKKLFESGIMK